jgi:GlpG protein
VEGEEAARTLGDYLYVQGIESEVEEGGGGSWRVWVLDEDRVDEAKGLLSRYLSMPGAAEFAAARAEAARGRAAGAAREAREAKALGKAAAAMSAAASGRGTRVTWATMGLAAGIWAASAWARSRGGGAEALVGALVPSPEGILAGRVWGLLTPALVHADFWSLLFNLFWFFEMGAPVERDAGPWRFGAMLATWGVATSLAWLYAGGWPGLYGAVYGLLGYTWTRARLDRGFRTWLSPLGAGLLALYAVMVGLDSAGAATGMLLCALLGGAAGWRDAKRAGRRGG